MPPPNHSEHIESLEDQVRSLLAALNARDAQAPPPNENASWFYPHLNAANPPAWLTDYSLFLKQLHIVFGDPDCIATAKQEIEVLSQTTSVATYLTQFHRLQKTLNWGEDAMAWF
ncbi:hypothetical protein NDA13_002500 [Ustilago tritici]|nr:hypothetical protein NDA13_002500 [Ustilago tritici]